MTAAYVLHRSQARVTRIRPDLRLQTSDELGVVGLPSGEIGSIAGSVCSGTRKTTFGATGVENLEQVDSPFRLGNRDVGKQPGEGQDI
jgi:hypothetical protein